MFFTKNKLKKELESEKAAIGNRILNAYSYIAKENINKDCLKYKTLFELIRKEEQKLEILQTILEALRWD